MEIYDGRRLEVLWDIRTGTRKCNVWWGAVIARVAKGKAASVSKTAKIRYDKLHGHNPTEYFVRFISSTVLEEAEGHGNNVRHLWRWAEKMIAEISENSGSSSVRKRTEEIAPICHPRQYVNNSDICSRVEALEAQLRDVRDVLRLRGLEGKQNSCRVLAFARHKLGLQLGRPLPGNSAALSKYRDAHSLVQESMTVQVDCSLEEFSSICEAVATEESEGVDISPVPPRVGSSKFGRFYRIRFQRFDELCKALGVSCLSDVQDSLLKVKNGKREQSPISVRVIGVLKQDGRSTNGPMILAVGSSISTHFKSSASVKVLYRSSRVWDQVEGRFAESLKAMEWPLSDIIAVESGDDQGSTSTLEREESEEPSVFCITWNRTSSVTERLFEAEDYDGVLGILEISVPHVVVRGLSFCAEVVRVCNRDFIGEGSHM